ncbi:paraquat-inducible protein B [Vibrio breoganii]|uniref:PqiB family protein n=1 Tax=Vibrio breoganii TaxID=553239 RepID=UPI000C823304|nr:MlaD family protein [Vibrio breoganii]PMG80096.1 paraquat-inducible protein B [Vibrio breoganii]PMK50797.1 paraquat-inducible protein B [Vibrio breoganii]PMO31324.1 paraquat-inducible protein B [Vibrio breoganii]PMO58354.1 paraquat-inducible protein B [Vibrio breoganii]
MTEQNQSSLPTPKVKRSTGLSPLWALPIVALLLGGWLMYKSVSEAGQQVRIHFANAQGLIAGRTTIRFQGLEVGMVRKLELAEDLNGIYVDAELYRDALQLLGEDTQFWLVKPTASLSGVSGLDALVSGNYIAIQSASKGFNTPPKTFAALSKAPQDLHSASSEGLRLTLRSKDLGSVNVGSKILFRKIPIGEVYSFSLDEDGKSVVLRAYIDEEYDHIITSESRFWNVSGINAKVGFDGVDVRVESLAALIGGGIAVDSPAQGSRVESDTEFRLYPDLATAGRGIPIKITLPDDNNINPTGAPLVYRGIEIGQITNVQLSKDRQDIIAQATVEPAYHDLLNSGSQFLLEEASLSLAGVENLGNFVTGNFLTLLPGDGEATRSFKAVKQDELNTQDSGNLALSLMAEHSFGLANGSAVLYKGIQIGHVTSSQLHDNGVKVNVLIDSQYRALIRSKNRFFVSSSVSASFDASKLNVNVPPLQHLLAGSISFIREGSESVSSSYTLYSSEALAELAIYTKSGSQVISLLASKMPPVNVGTPVLYRNLVVGQVLDYKLGHSGMEVIIKLDNQYHHLINSNTVFWNHSGVEIDAGLSGVSVKAAPLSRVLQGGIAFDTLPGVENKLGKHYKLYPNQDDARQFGKIIRINASDNASVTKGTKIKYQGVDVGEVTLVSPLFEKAGVEMLARIYPQFVSKIAVKGTKLWLVSPEISLSGVKNLASAIIPSIEVKPGTDSAKKNHFTLLKKAPLEDGVTFFLQTEVKGSVSKNTPILYREMEVGYVNDVQLGELADRVIITIKVDKDYAYLVRQNSLFWNVSGLDVSIGLSGANVKAGTVDSLLRGGIAFTTPEEQNLLPMAKAERSFYLYKKAEPAWLEWRTAIPKP